MRFIHYNVNEDGQPYARHTVLIPDALNKLREFPNDSIVTVVRGGPTDRALYEKMWAMWPDERATIEL